jgi:hypothetical protein
MTPRRVPGPRAAPHLPVDAFPAPGHLAGTMAKATPTRDAPQTASLRFSPINGVLIALGLVVIAAGYVLLARGSITAAPLLLVLGYGILIPLGIIL